MRSEAACWARRRTSNRLPFPLVPSTKDCRGEQCSAFCSARLSASGPGRPVLLGRDTKVALQRMGPAVSTHLRRTLLSCCPLRCSPGRDLTRPTSFCRPSSSPVPSSAHFRILLRRPWPLPVAHTVAGRYLWESPVPPAVPATFVRRSSKWSQEQHLAARGPQHHNRDPPATTPGGKLRPSKLLANTSKGHTFDPATRMGRCSSSQQSFSKPDIFASSVPGTDHAAASARGYLENPHSDFARHKQLKPMKKERRKNHVPAHIRHILCRPVGRARKCRNDFPASPPPPGCARRRRIPGLRTVSALSQKLCRNFGLCVILCAFGARCLLHDTCPIMSQHLGAVQFHHTADTPARKKAPTQFPKERADCFVDFRFCAFNTIRFRQNHKNSNNKNADGKHRKPQETTSTTTTTTTTN